MNSQNDARKTAHITGERVARMTKRFSPRERRLFSYLVVFVTVLGGAAYWRRWSPNRTEETAHYLIQSTATEAQTRNTGLVAEMLHAAYLEFLDEIGVTPREPRRLRMKLYGSREEMRFCNRMKGWAEAFYRKPYCHQYYPEHEVNPYHWMVHEATHQLSREVADLTLAKWLEEGIAEYFGCSRIVNGRMLPGEIDTNTYPVWWIDSLAVSGELAKDKANGSVIPLRIIVSGKGGPGMNDAFNLYYLHWWSLTHFLLDEKSGYRDSIPALVKHGGRLDHFESDIGSIDRIEKEWYAHVLDIKAKLAGVGSPPPTLAVTKGDAP